MSRIEIGIIVLSVLNGIGQLIAWSVMLFSEF